MRTHGDGSLKIQKDIRIKHKEKGAFYIDVSFSFKNSIEWSDNMAKKYYAVKHGRKPGVYDSWAACKAQVDGFSGATFKSFPTKQEAEAFVGGVFIPKKETLTPESSETQKNVPDISDILSSKDSRVAVSYVDGSYYDGTKEFSYGAVIAYQGEEYHFSEKVEDASLVSMRNVAGEIKGAECAMRFAVEHQCEELYIYHDYEGIAKWCLGEWKTNKEGTRAYKAYYDTIKDILPIHFVKVKGHSNDTYNDLADKLAKQALGLE